MVLGPLGITNNDKNPITGEIPNSVDLSQPDSIQFHGDPKGYKKHSCSIFPAISYKGLRWEAGTSFKLKGIETSLCIPAAAKIQTKDVAQDSAIAVLPIFMYVVVYCKDSASNSIKILNHEKTVALMTNFIDLKATAYDNPDALNIMSLARSKMDDMTTLEARNQAMITINKPIPITHNATSQSRALHTSTLSTYMASDDDASDTETSKTKKSKKKRGPNLHKKPPPMTISTRHGLNRAGDRDSDCGSNDSCGNVSSFNNNMPQPSCGSAMTVLGTQSYSMINSLQETPFRGQLMQVNGSIMAHISEANSDRKRQRIDESNGLQFDNNEIPVRCGTYEEESEFRLKMVTLRGLLDFLNK